MHFDFERLMREASRLTRSGNLAEATAAIQAALRRNSSATTPRQDESDVIDVEAWEVPESGEVTTASPMAGDFIAPVRGPAVPATSGKPATSADVFMAGSFRNSAGLRSYKLYVPPNAGDQPLPLVVMLHGCTQDADDFAAGTAMNDAARAQGFYVLYPIQSGDANPQKCWNWFKHNHQQQGRGEPSILAGMTREVMRTHAIDAGRVYVAGLSAGGAMAAILASAYPDLYAAAGVHSGLAPGAASDLPSALSAMKGAGARVSRQACSGVSTIVFHGDRDATVHPDNAKGVMAASVGASARIEAVRAPGMSSKRQSTRHIYRNPAGDIIGERWDIHGAGHAWAGGSENGSYTDRTGPDATAEMLRFFFERRLRGTPDQSL
jgi:poly(hydroxyalkanoate) depolymerase family esterase